MSTGSLVLHQPRRGPRAPSFSPFVLKLETFLRLAKLDYKNDFTSKPSPKGKVPWMTMDGQVVADSQFCIDNLNRKYNIDLSSHLTPEQRAVARAFLKMAEENMFWCLVQTRLNQVEWLKKIFKANSLFVWYASRKFHKQAHSQGMGRHTFEEMLQILESDLRALSDFLGSKKYFFGDKPCETDAALFGQLAQFVWQSPDTKAEKLIHDKFPNLCNYCERMKSELWPDWEDCITNDGAKTATK